METTTPAELKGSNRPICRFFVMGTCKFGVACSFSHDIPVVEEELKKVRKNIPCKWWFQKKKSCRFGSHCHFSHNAIDVCSEIANDEDLNDTEKRNSTTTCSDVKDEKFDCGVCLENVVLSGKRFGLLSKCEHCFCIDCLRKWRNRKSKQDPVVTSSCPTCRVTSDMVLPFKNFVVGHEKEILFQRYKSEMEKIPCRYFTGSPGSCPYGRSCYYAHLNWDGENVKPNDYTK